MILKLFEQLSQDFIQLLESEYDYNVIIEVGQQPNVQFFKAHSVILYQRSLYFRQNFVNAVKEDNIVEIKLPHVSVKLFNIIIKYIYGGAISLENFEASDIFDLMVISNELKLIKLVECLQSHLIDNNASWLRLNVFRVYQISFINESFEPLQQFCNDILVKNPSMVFDSDDFTTLQENALISLLRNDNLQMEESEIWDKIILWGKANTPNLPSNIKGWTNENFKSLKATLQHCLTHIRYFHILGKDVLNKIKPYRHILEEDLWDDIMAKFVDSDTPITSLILPPRKKEIIQLPSHKKETVQLPSHKKEAVQLPSDKKETIQLPSHKKETIQLPFRKKETEKDPIDVPKNPIFVPYPSLEGHSRKVAIATLSSSDIITLQHAAEISSWIDRCSTVYSIIKIPYEFKLLLRGSRDGFTCESFCRLCHNIPGTVVVLKVTGTDEILGGYNPLIWKVGGGSDKTADSFIFSLKNGNINQSILRRVNDTSRAIYNDDKSRPWFGAREFGIYDYQAQQWYCGGSVAYDKIRSKSGSFSIDEYEVFQICKKKTLSIS